MKRMKKSDLIIWRTSALVLAIISLIVLGLLIGSQLPVSNKLDRDNTCKATCKIYDKNTALCSCADSYPIDKFYVEVLR